MLSSSTALGVAAFICCGSPHPVDDARRKQGNLDDFLVAQPNQLRHPADTAGHHHGSCIYLARHRPQPGWYRVRTGYALARNHRV